MSELTTTELTTTPAGTELTTTELTTTPAGTDVALATSSRTGGRT